VNIELPDGTILEGIPEGTTKPQLIANLKASGYDVRPLMDQLSNETSEKIKNSVVDGMSDYQKVAAGAGKAVYDLARGAGQITGLVDQKDIDDAKRLDAPLMNTGAGTLGNISGNILSSVPAAFVPGANTAVGASLIGAGMGALQPTSAGDSRLLNTAVGAGAGLAGYGLGKGLNKSVTSASGKVASIESKVAEKAAADAAAETATARSAAGNAAQNAYRQLEHLRELGALRSLTPDEALIAANLEKELASKAMEKLVPAVNQKESAAAAFREALETQEKRAAELTAKRLGGGEVKSQVMARVKRYGPAAFGGIVGNMIFPGLGGSVGGAATGLVLRPALRSMINLSKNPAVQHQLLSPIATSGLLGNPALPRSLGLLSPSVYFGNE
jgi:hypothetical protein